MIEYPDLHDAKVANKSLRELFLTGIGGARDSGTRAKVQQLCWLASSVNDPYCAARINTVEGYADALFSDDEHKKWDRPEMTGVEYLRMSILRELDAHERQLAHLETVRQAGGMDEYIKSLTPRQD